MTLFGELYFFVCAGVLLIPALILGCLQKPLKYYGLMLSVAFILLALKDEPAELFYMMCYLAYQLVLINIFLRLRSEKGARKGIFRVFILLSLAPLVIYKIAGLFALSILGFMGISYMTFKALQVIIEIEDGLIRECDCFDLIYFLIFFPTVLSGPIDRSRRFASDLASARPREEYLELVGAGLFKICQGLVYKFVLAQAVFQAITYLGMEGGLLSNVVYLYSYGLYLFFDFAGYSLMAIGTGYILGVVTPENFREPFLSVDIRDFWDRWHITLSHWFRDFVFSRFMMASIRGRWFKSKLTGASLGFMINMLLMGLWHGLTASYVLYGLYHGLLLALTEIYQKKSKFYKKHKKDRWYLVASWFVTFNLVMFGFFIFSGRLLEIIR